MTDEERLAEIVKYGSTSTEREQPENDRRFLLRLINVERAKSAEAERLERIETERRTAYTLGRIAMRDEALEAIRRHCRHADYSDDPVVEDEIVGFAEAIEATISALPDDPPLTTPPGQTSPAAQSNLTPLRDAVTGVELVQRTPAPNSSAPAVPICTVGVKS